MRWLCCHRNGSNLLKFELSYSVCTATSLYFIEISGLRKWTNFPELGTLRSLLFKRTIFCCLLGIRHFYYVLDNTALNYLLKHFDLNFRKVLIDLVLEVSIRK